MPIAGSSILCRGWVVFDCGWGETDAGLVDGVCFLSGKWGVAVCYFTMKCGLCRSGLL